METRRGSRAAFQNERENNFGQRNKVMKRKKATQKREPLRNISNKDRTTKRRKVEEVRPEKWHHEEQPSPAEISIISPDLEARFNIDQDDEDNPQCVTDYVMDIYKYMRQLEQTYYMEGRSKRLADRTIQMRVVLIDWLVDVHLQFRFLQETLYLTVNILDRFFHAKSPYISKKSVQLIGVAAMLIASKYEEMYPPSITDFVYITDRTYLEHQIRAMEVQILTTLKFNISPPLLINFLRRFSKASEVEARVHVLAKYIMECSLLDYEISNMFPCSLVATASLCLSLEVHMGLGLNDVWNGSLEYHSTYKKSEVIEVLGALKALILAVSNEENKPTSVRRKYRHKSFLCVADLPDLKTIGQ